MIVDGNGAITKVVRSISAANVGINVYLRDEAVVGTEGDPVSDDAALDRLNHPERAG